MGMGLALEKEASKKDALASAKEMLARFRKTAVTQARIRWLRASEKVAMDDWVAGDWGLIWHQYRHDQLHPLEVRWGWNLIYLGRGLYWGAGGPAVDEEGFSNTATRAQWEFRVGMQARRDEFVPFKPGRVKGDRYWPRLGLESTKIP